MNKQQRQQVDALWITGMHKAKIARELNLPASTVAGYLRRHPVPEGVTACKECGAFITQASGRKSRKFCCDKCRITWWNNHRLGASRNTIAVTCHHCGKEFQSYESDNRKYCSKPCYHAARAAGTATSHPDQLLHRHVDSTNNELR